MSISSFIISMSEESEAESELDEETSGLRGRLYLIISSFFLCFVDWISFLFGCLTTITFCFGFETSAGGS